MILVPGCLLVLVIPFALSQCPWQLQIVELQSACICSYNLGHELSVQCDMVEWPKLLTALHTYSSKTALDLLYVNNSTISTLRDNDLVDLEIHNLQLSGCAISSVSQNAFMGQEKHLRNLNLQDNDLTTVPIDSLKPLRALILLDLSHNRITNIPNGAFKTLTKLATLKLSDNNITLERDALQGLENNLKNLNLKGTRQKYIPDAIEGMRMLAFLDLSQNSLREIPSKHGLKSFKGVESLTALNLERNLIQMLGPHAFDGIQKTLSSLSLLNNLLPDFPTQAISTLSELRVLDIGFNLITELPENAFKGNPSITLLALDGNPLPTIPYEALAHLNHTLRGLSLGGRFLHCDCKLSWVVEWIKNGDLQVTSRERNPQFCGSPPKFRDRGFYTIQLDELACKKNTTPTSSSSPNVGVAVVVNSGDLDDMLANETTLNNGTHSTRNTTKPVVATSTSTSTSSTTSTSTTTTSTHKAPTIKTKVRTTTTTTWKTSQRPSLVMTYPSSRAKIEEREVIVKTAFRQDNSVIIQWGSETDNILGFRVVYRLFGDKSFKQGPPLEASEREFKIKNVPSQECIIVCVVSLEELNVTPDNVPFNQCREVRTVSSASSNMDKITIAASAAICGTIVVAVIVFVAASRRRSKKLHDLHQQQKMSLKNGVPVASLPVNCCGPGASPGGPLTTLSAYNNNKDWDQVSAYSAHSIQRPRLYPVEQPSSLIVGDDLRSHYGTKSNKSRSMADGQSQHSFSNHSSRYLAANAFPNNLLASRQDLRHSRQSLTMQSDRMSTRGMGNGTGNGALHHLTSLPHQSITSSSRRSSRPRSRSRDHNHPGSRYSLAGSTHTLNNYCDTSDNWTDHDMDIYMARNPTTRNGLVPL